MVLSHKKQLPSNTPIPEKNGSCVEVRLNNHHGKFKITNIYSEDPLWVMVKCMYENTCLNCYVDF